MLNIYTINFTFLNFNRLTFIADTFSLSVRKATIWQSVLRVIGLKLPQSLDGTSAMLKQPLVWNLLFFASE